MISISSIQSEQLTKETCFCSHLEEIQSLVTSEADRNHAEMYQFLRTTCMVKVKSFQQMTC